MPRKTYAKASLLSAAAEDDGTREDDSAPSSPAPQTPGASGSTADGDSSSVDTVVLLGAVLSAKEPRSRSKRQLEIELQRLERQQRTIVRELEEVMAADAAAEAEEAEEAEEERRTVVSQGGRLKEEEEAVGTVTAGGEVPPPFWQTRLWWAKFWVVVTGIWWGICMQLLYYEGASSPASALPNVDWYVGMMIVDLPRLWRKRDPRFGQVKQRHMIPIAIFDLLGTVGTTVGLELAGSAIFGIILGSITMWTALFTRLIMGQRQSWTRLFGISVVICGLAIPMTEYKEDPDQDGSPELLWGVALTFGGTFFYALEYTLCERVYTLYALPLDARQLCFCTGAWGLLVTAVWIGAVTGPNWKSLVTDEVAEHEGNGYVIAALYLSHTLNNAVHNLAWFYVCELEGGVTTGLLQGVKAALLFVASSAAFCSAAHPEQCYTPAKLGATATVLGGTCIYYATCPASWTRRWTRGGRNGGRKLAIDVVEPGEPATLGAAVADSGPVDAWADV